MADGPTNYLDASSGPTSVAGADIAAIPSATPAAIRGKGRVRNFWALQDQVLISGTNFLTMVWVARGLDVSAFGEFTLVFSGLLFANMYQTALMTQPHNVLGTSRSGRAYARFTTDTFIIQLLLALGQGVLALAAAWFAFQRGWHCAPLLLALAPSIAAWQLQEFVRRVLYTEGRTAAAFLNDLISYGGQSAAIFVLLWLHRLTGPSALYALAATSAAAAMLGVWQVHRSFSPSFHLAAAARECWQFGKWLAAAETLTWLSSLQMYFYLAAVILGPWASGELKGAQILFGPTRVFSFFLCTVLPIQFTQKLLAGGDRALDRQFRQVILLALPPLAGYCGLVALFAAPLLHLTYGKSYTGNPHVLALYSVVAFLNYLQLVVAAALTAKHMTRQIFLGSAVGAAIALVVSYPLILWLGIDGALAAMILTSTIVTVYLWRQYRREITGDLPLVAGMDESESALLQEHAAA
ncbi:MAG TPA: polysaccharide biosynthesis C-terminal domain-containing protein [Tepidisphaeraceae bacterium]|jgi:O-antigen/teichoic acid export membrane protein|nr:polysaccharide biosynthesis C-terminal domain-containing protein [Tepidisphaeraceae bacterium]